VREEIIQLSRKPDFMKPTSPTRASDLALQGEHQGGPARRIRPRGAHFGVDSERQGAPARDRRYARGLENATRVVTSVHGVTGG